MPAYVDYLRAARGIIERIEATQAEALRRASEICAGSIAAGGLVHLFGSGHSRIAVEEIFPRYGSFPGFHPLVELSLTFHTNVVGPDGQRQAMYLEGLEGFAEVILSNFSLGASDSAMIFSTSGNRGVSVDMALEMRKRGLPVIAVTSVAHSTALPARHSGGKRLFEIANVVVDHGTPPGDALVRVPGLREPVGPGSTIGAVAVANAIKCEVARLLVERGQPPIVLTSPVILGEEAAAEQLERCYRDYRERTRRL